VKWFVSGSRAMSGLVLLAVPWLLTWPEGGFQAELEENIRSCGGFIKDAT
jgi:hypothetical protein